MKKLLSCMIVGAFSLASFAFSQQQATEQYSPSDREGSSRVFVGADWHHLQQKHETATTNKATSNPWAGIVGYQFKERDNIYFQGKAQWGGGSLKGKSDYVFESYNHNWGVDARVGYMFGVGQESEFGITPYVGVVYNVERFSVNKPAAMVTNASKMKMINWYLPFGVALDWQIVPEFNIGLDVQGQWLMSSKMKVTEGAWKDQNEKYKKRVNWLVEVPMTYQLTSAWDLCLVPFYSHSRYHPKSAIAAVPVVISDYMGKIKNSTWGARLELGYSF